MNTLVFLTVVIGSTSALKCMSGYDRNDDIWDFSSNQCYPEADTDFYCYKKLRTDPETGEKLSLNKGCTKLETGTEVYPENKCIEELRGEVDFTICTCNDKDDCNGAEGKVITFACIVFAVIFAAFM